MGLNEIVDMNMSDPSGLHRMSTRNMSELYPIVFNRINLSSMMDALAHPSAVDMTATGVVYNQIVHEKRLKPPPPEMGGSIAPLVFEQFRMACQDPPGRMVEKADVPLDWKRKLGDFGLSEGCEYTRRGLRNAMKYLAQKLGPAYVGDPDMVKATSELKGSMDLRNGRTDSLYRAQSDVNVEFLGMGAAGHLRGHRDVLSPEAFLPHCGRVKDALKAKCDALHNERYPGSGSRAEQASKDTPLSETAAERAVRRMEVAARVRRSGTGSGNREDGVAPYFDVGKVLTNHKFDVKRSIVIRCIPLRQFDPSQPLNSPLHPVEPKLDFLVPENDLKRYVM